MGEIVRVEDAALEEWVSLRNGVFGWWPLDADSIRHEHRRGRPRIELAARERGRIVGGASASVPELDSDQSITYVSVWVLPELRRRGIGTALFRVAHGQAAAWRRPTLQALAREGDGGAVFLERCGFAEFSRTVRLELDPRAATVSQGDGVQIVTAAERPDLLRGAYEVELESLPDVPGPERLRPGTYEEWHAREFERPGVRPEGWFFAVADGEVVGFALLDFPAAWPGSAFHEFTGVRRAWRGRGIAGALKAAQIRWAAAAGLERLVTENHEENEPIRRLNERLGYRPGGAIVVLRKPV